MKYCTATVPGGARRSARALWCALALGVLLAGCATPVPKVFSFDSSSNSEGAAPRTPIVWPAPPEPARYAWTGQLLGEANFKAVEEKKVSAMDVLRWLVGLFSGDARPLQVQRPQSGVVDAAGRIYVTDMGNAAVYVFDRVDGVLEVWDKAEGLANFRSPVGIAFGPNGDLLVADSQLGFVARLDTGGNPRGSIGKGVLTRPTGLAYDPLGKRIYVSDTAAHDIKVFDDDGRLLKTIGRRGEEKGEFNFPTHLAFALGELYVTDTMNSRIQVLSDEGAVVKMSFGALGTSVGNLVRPKGVAVDGEGHIYVVESYNDHLLVFNRSGELLLAIGGNGPEPGKFDLPAGVWVDRDNRVFVADMLNARVAVFQFLGAEK